MCEQKCFPNGKVRKTLLYLLEDWYTRMMLHKGVNEIEILGGFVWPQKNKKKVCKVFVSQNFVHWFVRCTKQIYVLQIRAVAKSQCHVNFILVLNTSSIYLLPSSSIHDLEVLYLHFSLCKMSISYFWSAQSFPCFMIYNKVNGKNR